MPPKAKDSEQVTALAKEFESFGLSTAKSVEVARNSKQASAFQSFISSNAGTLQSGQVTAKQGNLLLQLATANESLAEDRRAKVTDEILTERLLSADQVTGELMALLQLVYKLTCPHRGNQVLLFGIEIRSR